MPLVFYLVAGILAAAGVTAIIQGCLNERHRRRQVELHKGPRPYHPSMPSVADQVEEWLKQY